MRKSKIVFCILQTDGQPNVKFSNFSKRGDFDNESPITISPQEQSLVIRNKNLS